MKAQKSLASFITGIVIFYRRLQFAVCVVMGHSRLVTGTPHLTIQALLLVRIDGYRSSTIGWCMVNLLRIEIKNIQYYKQFIVYCIKLKRSQNNNDNNNNNNNNNNILLLVL